MNLPPKTPKSWAPGVTSRYDDFTAAHINMTLLIHGNGVFLSWHRHFLYLFEKPLIEECNYKGAVPYWNWPWWADNLAKSQLFDGSETSISGNGYWNESAPVQTNGNYTFPRGHGGECIEDGPFANITTGFRSFTLSEFLAQGLPSDALEYAPRCVVCDLNSAISVETPEIVSAMISASTIRDFQNFLDRLDTINTNVLSSHPGGHMAIGQSMND